MSIAYELRIQEQFSALEEQIKALREQVLQLASLLEGKKKTPSREDA